MLDRRESLDRAGCEQRCRPQISMDSPICAGKSRESMMQQNFITLRRRMIVLHREGSCELPATLDKCHGERFSTCFCCFFNSAVNFKSREKKNRESKQSNFENLCTRCVPLIFETFELNSTTVAHEICFSIDLSIDCKFLTLIETPKQWQIHDFVKSSSKPVS